MTARRLTQARFTREQARFISKTPGLDPAIKAAIRQAAVSGSTVTLRARQHEDLIRAVGRQAVALAAEAAGLSVTAVDVSPWAVDNVKNKVDVAFVADVERLDWVGRYDIVLCSGVLDYVSRPAVAVRNLCRFVSPAGRLVVLVPRVGVGGSVHALIARRASGLRVNLFTATWLAREAKRWGLELIQARRPLPTIWSPSSSGRLCRPSPLSCSMAGATRVVISADDFRLAEGVNWGVIEADETGSISSASLVANLPAFAGREPLSAQTTDGSRG